MNIVGIAALADIASEVFNRLNLENGLAMPSKDFNPQDPHASQPVLTIGPAPEQAGAAIVMVHGRGATAQSILTLYNQLDAESCAALAPQAGGNSWYPHTFLAPLESNQPYLDSALRRLNSLVADLISRNIPSERIILFGFSQGACLSLEFAARHPRRYGAIIGLTGGLIGPPGTPRNYPGSFVGTPVFLGASDPDPHVPFERVQETQTVLKQMGASVELRRYPGMPHTITNDELDASRAIIKIVASSKMKN